MAKVLIVEDDLIILASLRDILTFDTHQIESSANGLDGYDLTKSFSYDLMILDWDLPGMTGLDICKKFRWGGGMTPVLMLTGKNSPEEKEMALDAGADDYVCKPFNAKELRARVRALLRRPQQMLTDVLSCKGISLNSNAHSASLNDKPLKLTAREFQLLEFFLRYPDQVFSLEALLSRLWPDAGECSEEAVRTAIKRLREKLGESGSALQTIYGAGYHFNSKPDAPAQ